MVLGLIALHHIIVLFCHVVLIVSTTILIRCPCHILIRCPCHCVVVVALSSCGSFVIWWPVVGVASAWYWLFLCECPVCSFTVGICCHLGSHQYFTLPELFHVESMDWGVDCRNSRWMESMEWGMESME